MALTVVTVFVTLRLPREILPQVDEGTAVAELSLPEGTAIEETARQTGRLEAAAKASAARVSTAGSGSPPTKRCWPAPTPARADGAVHHPGARGAERPALRRPAARRRARPRGRFAGHRPGGPVGVREPDRPRRTAGTRRGDRAQARRGGPLGRFGAPAHRAAQDARGCARCVLQHPAQVEVTLERERIAERGLSVEAVANALAGGLGGVASGDLRETDRRTPITVRFAGNANEDLDTALQTQVHGVPVGQLVSVQETRAPIEVVRVNQRPVSVVEAVVERGGTARATDDVSGALAGLKLPAGVSWQITGADAEQQRTTQELSLVALLSVALMFLVLAGEFASFTIPLLVMLTVPLAAAGGILFLWITGQSLNAVSLIGIVVMIGMADNEAVVKLDAIRRFRELGHSIEEAVLLGGRQRLRAIAMTSITTITGVLPLVFGWGSGGALYQPLAAGVIGGRLGAAGDLLPAADRVCVVERRKDAKTQRRKERAPVASEVVA